MLYLLSQVAYVVCDRIETTIARNVGASVLYITYHVAEIKWLIMLIIKEMMS